MPPLHLRGGIKLSGAATRVYFASTSQGGVSKPPRLRVDPGLRARGAYYIPDEQTVRRPAAPPRRVCARRARPHRRCAPRRARPREVEHDRRRQVERFGPAATPKPQRPAHLRPQSIGFGDDCDFCVEERGSTTALSSRRSSATIGRRRTARLFGSSSSKAAPSSGAAAAILEAALDQVAQVSAAAQAPSSMLFGHPAVLVAPAWARRDASQRRRRQIGRRKKSWAAALASAESQRRVARLRRARSSRGRRLTIGEQAKLGGATPPRRRDAATDISAPSRQRQIACGVLHCWLAGPVTASRSCAPRSCSFAISGRVLPVVRRPGLERGSLANVAVVAAMAASSMPSKFVAPARHDPGDSPHHPRGIHRTRAPGAAQPSSLVDRGLVEALVAIGRQDAIDRSTWFRFQRQAASKPAPNAA